jgi:hypothetical protein
MAKQNLDGPQVARRLVDKRCLCSVKRMGAVFVHIEADRTDHIASVSRTTPMSVRIKIRYSHYPSPLVAMINEEIMEQFFLTALGHLLSVRLETQHADKLPFLMCTQHLRLVRNSVRVEVAKAAHRRPSAPDLIS